MLIVQHITLKITDLLTLKYMCWYTFFRGHKDRSQQAFNHGQFFFIAFHAVYDLQNYKENFRLGNTNPTKKRGLSRVLISTAGDRSFLRKTRIISGAYFYCWPQKFSQKNRDYLGCLFLVFLRNLVLPAVEISTRDNTRFSEKTCVASGTRQ
jgi:hypothetical protein